MNENFHNWIRLKYVTLKNSLDDLHYIKLT